MTLAARQVLLDCEATLLELREDPKGSAWRRRWAAQLALLRTVMHVLKNVDGERSEALGRAINESWDRLKESKPYPPEFWQFIEEERNNLLKEYRTVVQQLVTVVPVPPSAQRRPGHATTAQYTFTIEAGPFQGQDARDVAGRAIEWLRTYLDAVDSRAQELDAGAA
jgi:hypothetical protein